MYQPPFNPSRYIQDDPENRHFAVHRDVFRDPQIFAREMRDIFETSWIFVGLASQVPHPHDFITTHVGRQPVAVSRDAKGTLHCIFNTCRHRGAAIFKTASGNARSHVCAYHGWAYDSGGRNIFIKDAASGDYAEQFKGTSHDMQAVPRFDEYRGFLFASLADSGPSLQEYLGYTRVFLDMIVDQSPDGIELVPGIGIYTFKANWKLQIENCTDAYHLTSTHPSLMKVVERRQQGQSGHRLATIDFNLLGSTASGGFTFPYGHALVWGGNPTPEVRPLFGQVAELRERVGDRIASWMLGVRNLTLFPSVQFAENAALQLRVIRPLAPDLTEMRIYCMAPVGEPAALRAHRIRLYEDFFNSSGLATPDDSQVYEDCQSGFNAWHVIDQQGYHRGLASVRQGPDDAALELGIQPATSGKGFPVQDETVFHAAYREWLRLLAAGAGAGAEQGVTP